MTYTYALHFGVVPTDPADYARFEGIEGVVDQRTSWPAVEVSGTWQVWGAEGQEPGSLHIVAYCDDVPSVETANAVRALLVPLVERGRLLDYCTFGSPEDWSEEWGVVTFEPVTEDAPRGGYLHRTPKCPDTWDVV